MKPARVTTEEEASVRLLMLSAMIEMLPPRIPTRILAMQSSVLAVSYTHLDVYKRQEKRE